MHQISPYDIDYEMEQDTLKSAIPVIQPLGSFRCTTFGTSTSARHKFVDELKRAYDISTTMTNKKEILNLLRAKKSNRDD